MSKKIFLFRKLHDFMQLSALFIPLIVSTFTVYLKNRGAMAFGKEKGLTSEEVSKNETEGKRIL